MSRIFFIFAITSKPIGEYGVTAIPVLLAYQVVHRQDVMLKRYFNTLFIYAAIYICGHAVCSHAFFRNGVGKSFKG